MFLSQDQTLRINQALQLLGKFPIAYHEFNYNFMFDTPETAVDCLYPCNEQGFEVSQFLGLVGTVVRTFHSHPSKVEKLPIPSMKFPASSRFPFFPLPLRMCLFANLKIMFAKLHYRQYLAFCFMKFSSGISYALVDTSSVLEAKLGRTLIIKNLLPGVEAVC